MDNRDTLPIVFMKASGVEIWSTFDREARVWDLWTSPGCTTYVGGAEHLADVRRIALEWIEQHRAGSTVSPA